MENEVGILQLVTRQLVIGKVSVVEDEVLGVEQYTVENPYEVMVVPGQGGRPEVRLMEYGREGGLLPALPLVTFEYWHVMHARECPEKFLQAYTEATSGIHIAGAGEAQSVIQRMMQGGK